MWGYWSFSKIPFFFLNTEKTPPTDFFSLTFSRRHFECNFSERNHPKKDTCSGTFHTNGWNMEGLKVCSKWLRNSYKYFCAVLQETDAGDEEKHGKRGLGKSARHREGARGSKRSRRSVFPGAPVIPTKGKWAENWLTAAATSSDSPSWCKTAGRNFKWRLDQSHSKLTYFWETWIKALV